MRFTTVIIATLAASAYAFDHSALMDEINEIAKRDAEASPEAISEPDFALEDRSGGNSCPTVWTQVATFLTTAFVTNGQCNDNARAAIRAAFHDAGAWNTSQTYVGADGSLCLAGEATNRAENNGLQNICSLYSQWVVKFPGINMSDLIQFAAASAVVLCPGGQPYKILVGRTDSSTPAANGLLPDVNADAASLYALFQAKGFNAVDLAALLGAHTCSKSFSDPAIPVGGSQDDTPGLWDVKYYSETTNPPANVYPFQSDKVLAQHPVVGKEFAGFVNNQGKWTGKFGDAMSRMSLLGVKSTSSFADCTNSLPKAQSSKRDTKRSILNYKAV